MDVFRALVDGYLHATGGLLVRAETDAMAYSAWLMTYECGIRFLTDHLQGDTYFKISAPGHNLKRCREHFALLQSMENQYARMQDIVGECLVACRAG